MNKVMVAMDERHDVAGITAVAAALAGPGAEVDVVHVLEPGSARSVIEADATVAEAVDLIRARGLIGRGHLASAVRGVAPRLVEQARELGAGLVVIGSRGVSDVAGLGGRSVGHVVLAELDVPVLVLPVGAFV